MPQISFSLQNPQRRQHRAVCQRRIARKRLRGFSGSGAGRPSTMLSRFFRNSPELLVLKILEDEQIDPQELERLKSLIEKSK